MFFRYRESLPRDFQSLAMTILAAAPSRRHTEGREHYRSPPRCHSEERSDVGISSSIMKYNHNMRLPRDFQSLAMTIIVELQRRPPPFCLFRSQRHDGIFFCRRARGYQSRNQREKNTHADKRDCRKRIKRGKRTHLRHERLYDNVYRYR